MVFGLLQIFDIWSSDGYTGRSSVKYLSIRMRDKDISLWPTTGDHSSTKFV